jgi:hypothetical protein
MKTNKKLTSLFGFLGLYLISAGVSWLIFSTGASSVNPVSSGEVTKARTRIDTNAPKTESCPINGQMFTKAEREIWEGRRPLTAIIENHLDSRPQSGISKADVVYEAVAEGGITRFLNVFYCGVSADELRIGPLRSARVYFINWASEYSKSPIFVHVGGANSVCNSCPGGVKPKGQVAKEVDAFKLLVDIGWRFAKGNAMDGGTNVGFPVVWRDYERIPGAATEHTFLGSIDKLFEEAEKRNFGAKGADGVAWDANFTKWQFADEKPLSSPTAETISFEFWSNKGDYDVEWKYDKVTNRYLRFNGGKAHIDMETKEQLSAKNVIIQFVDEKEHVDQEGHNFYQNIGQGKAIFFQNGDVAEGTWKKTTREARTVFLDKNGREITIVRGNVWIEGVPTGNTIKY